MNNTIQNGSINPESGVARHFADRGLSPTEARVLELFADGRYTSKDIASELGCSPSTVDKHMRSICLKTGATGRVSLMQRIADRRTGAR